MNLKRLLLAIVAAIDLGGMIQPALAQDGILRANDPQAQINLREAPNLDSRRLGYGVVGDRVEILQQTAGADHQAWYRVRFYRSGAVGWIRQDFIKLEADSAAAGSNVNNVNGSASALRIPNRSESNQPSGHSSDRTENSTANSAAAREATAATSPNSSRNRYQAGYDRGYQYGVRDGQNARRYNAGYHPDKILQAGSGSNDANYDRGFRAGFFAGFEVGYNGQRAPEPTPVTEGTILTFQTRNYAVRVFGRHAQTLMNIYDKRKGATWLNSVPVEIEQVTNGLYYHYDNEAVRAFQGADGSRSLEIGDKVEAAQSE